MAASTGGYYLIRKVVTLFLKVLTGLVALSMIGLSHSVLSQEQEATAVQAGDEYQFSAAVTNNSGQPLLRLRVAKPGVVDGNFDIDRYYESAMNITGQALKTALHRLIDGHEVREYRDLWSLYTQSGRDNYYDQDHSILDIYSEVANAADPYNYRGSSQQCRGRIIDQEGECYNREHIFPRSWFDDEQHPAFSDAHHILASDAFVNSLRSNFPHGDVAVVEQQSLNGSTLGVSQSDSFVGMVFEPIDEFKGDIARIYFYMATRYQNEIADWRFNNSRGTDVLDGSSYRVYEDWFIEQLLVWHDADPVGDYEIDRNNAVFNFQGNRNPFIDNPSWVRQIWQ